MIKLHIQIQMNLNNFVIEFYLDRARSTTVTGLQSAFADRFTKLFCDISAYSIKT